MTLLTRETRAPVVDVDVDARRVTVRLCRWDEPSTVIDPGAPPYREAFTRGGLDVAGDVHVTDHHYGNLIGRADTATFRDDGDGPTVELVLARTAAAADTLALIEADVIRSVSMEFQSTSETDRDGVLWRTGVVHGVAFAFRPAHAAEILATRETQPSGEPMTITETAADTPPPLPADPADITVTAGQLSRSLDELRDDLTRTLIAERPDPTVAADTLAGLAFRSFGDYALAAYDDPANPILRRALVDQITPDNPGVVPPAWLREVQGIIDRGAPTITAFGRESLPSTGMTLEWPYYDGDLAELVAEQMAEKTAIKSVKVSLKRGSEDIHTFAGGSDISYQLIRRSSPSYLSAYLQIMTAAYSLVTDMFAADAVTAAATPSAAAFDPATGTYAELVAALVVASIEVEAATGAPAGFALAGTDVYVAAAVASATAVTPIGAGGVNGVTVPTVIHDPQLAPDALIVSNTQSASWYAEGPFTVSADDIEKLGQNTAVWGMGAMAFTAAAGVKSVGAVAATTQTAKASK